MIELEELIKLDNEQNSRFEELKKSIHLDELQMRLLELEKLTESQDFWNNPEKSAVVLSEINDLKKRISSFNEIKSLIETNNSFIELLQEESDDEIAKELEKSIKDTQMKLDNLEISTLLSDKYDKNNAIVTIHPGAGGTEAMDWADMLYRMYTRWSEQNGFKVTELDFEPGEEAGAKSVSFLVEGSYAYGYLKSEHGVHRLVRISLFDSCGRRHTSFASIEVLPEIDDFESKLIALKEKENKATINDLKGIQMDIAWGSQIRSYVFCPYTMVKDHRTNHEVGDVQKVMDGDLNGFIYAYLKQNAK